MALKSVGNQLTANDYDIVAEAEGILRDATAAELVSA